MHIVNTINLTDGLIYFLERDVIRNTLQKNERSALDWSKNQDNFTKKKLELYPPSGSAEEKIMQVMTREIMGSK